MKKVSVILIFLFMISGTIMAQNKDSIVSKKIVEKGAKGDIILGKQNKKKQLTAAPTVLKKQHSLHQPNYIPPKKRKAKTKIGKNNN